ncbi:hypothetical protein RKE29_06400 [Streptomyces sp. B1866]|uniref:hypothetical protein n=1 Tax=Streptomyces sp. B1866 TaxID=3075431 RepID=UPI002890AA5D|nr:hypothetical protein [Streptomyces sp. B1866]MDT3396271.1 hypothetical protein [Streptomyces sp. B1866]
MSTMPPDSCALYNHIVSQSWVEPNSKRLVPCLLITHPGPRHPVETLDYIEREMRDLAGALGMAPQLHPVYTGTRVLVENPTLIRVRGDRCKNHELLIRVTQHWSRIAATGCPILLLVGLDPLPGDADEPSSLEYIDAQLTRGRLLLGQTDALTFPDGADPHVA